MARGSSSISTPVTPVTRVGSRASIDSAISTVSESPLVLAASEPSTPVLRSSRRASSIASGISSYTGSTTTGLNSYGLSVVPVGLNRLGSGHNRLGVNSIGDLVDWRANDETRRPSHSSIPFKPPSSKDIPPVTLSPTPRVKRDELRKYLADVSSEYETFYGTRLNKPGVSYEDSLSVLSGGPSSVVSIDESTTVRSPSRTANGITPLSTIPSVFFEENFQLDNPKVFDVVSERSEITHRPDTPEIKKIVSEWGDAPQILANSSILQEKLSWYIDTVELHLINEISDASKSFFSTLDDLKQIHEGSSRCIERIQQLRNELEEADQNIALRGINEIKLRQTTRNAAVLSQSLKQISTVYQKADQAESLLLSQETDKCLDVIDSAEALLEGVDDPVVREWTTGWKYPLCDLRSVSGLSDLRESLCTLRTKAGESYGHRFTEILLQDLERHMGAIPKQDTLQRLGRVLEKTKQPQSFNTSYIDINVDLRKSLNRQLYGLARSDNTAAAFNAYKEAVVKQVKNVVRMNLPSKSDTASMTSNITSRSVADKSTSLASSLRAMTVQESETMISDIYTSLSELYRRLSTQQKLLLDLTSSLKPTKGAPLTSAIDLSDLLLNVIKNSESRMTKVLKVRREQAINLGLQDFINFYSLNGMYLAECEAICGDPSSELHALLTGFIKQFLAAYHVKRDLELAQLMSRDRWKEEEISKQFQEIVDNIVQSGEVDPAVWLSCLKVVLGPPDQKQEAQSGNKKLPRNVFVENSSFIVSNAAIYTIGMAEGYLKLIVLLPHLSSEIVSNLIELIRKFNSRATQLILGAGATKSAGLKHISAKHLALASESLNIVMTLIPYMKKCAQRHLQTATAALSEFDNVVRELKEHRQEIHKKFVSLMTDKITIHCNTIANTNWAVPGPHKYMEDLVNETGVLIKVLSKVLPKQAYLVSIIPVAATTVGLTVVNNF
jgi:vacuolar protein sorting-associated protein 54